jgi:[acyl-carrier-protein] S-malonyltransferase
MAPARAGLSEALRKVHLASPSVPVYANANAEPVTDAVTARTLLIEQLTAPVRWTQTIERLAQRFPNSLFVEMGPGSVLTGLVKKIVPGAQVLTCGGESDLNALLANVTP